MRRAARGAAWAAFALLAAAGPGRAAETAPGAPPDAAPPDAPAPTPAAGPAGQPCGTQAAHYADGGKVDLAVTRVGQVRVENPLRPLTPEVNHVLQVVIAGKVATAYGPDLATLRRGGTPAAVEAMLGGPIRWQAELPTLPDPIAIVAEDGTPMTDLAFRACEAPPPVKAAPQAKGSARGGAKGAARGDRPKAGQKTPAGFTMPQGAVPE